MKKHANFHSLVLGRAGRITAALAVTTLLVAGIVRPVVNADIYDEQIQALQGQNAQAQESVTNLQAQANSYAGAVTELQNKINSVQGQINANQAEQVRLTNEIAAKQAELDSQKKILGDDIKAMYVDGQISTIEMLATSKNLSEFVDKEEYRNLVQQKIQATLVSINELQAKLKLQKVQVEQLLKDQTAQQAQLAADRNQQYEMLAYTQSQKDQFNTQIAANKSKIGELRTAQIAANARFIGPAGNGPACGGGYPAKWCEIPQDAVIDSWGMYNRECVSYTAFKVHLDFLSGRTSRDMPYWGGIGNANQWDDNARNQGIPVDNNPTPGSIAVSNAGYYGHVMYVESVNGDGTINISQYNASLNGRYSERYGLSPAGLVFIHF